MVLYDNLGLIGYKNGQKSKFDGRKVLHILKNLVTALLYPRKPGLASPPLSPQPPRYTINVQNGDMKLDLLQCYLKKIEFCPLLDRAKESILFQNVFLYVVSKL